MGSWLHYSPPWLSSTQATISILCWWSHILCPHHSRNHHHLLTSFVPSYGLCLTFRLLHIFRFILSSINLYFDLLLLLHNCRILIRVMIFIASLHGYCTYLPWQGHQSILGIIHVHGAILHVNAGKAGEHLAAVGCVLWFALLLICH